MSMSASTATATKWIGLAAGILLAAGLVHTWQIPAEGGVIGADVRLAALPAGELQLRPTAVFLSGHGLVPGGRGARGSIRVTNITGTPVAVDARLTPSSPALDRALSVRLDTAARRLLAGPLGELRRWRRLDLRLDPGETAALQARVTIPRNPAAAEAGGQTVEVTTELRARRAGAGP